MKSIAHKSTRILAFFMISALGLSSCTWVELDEKGYNVALIDAEKSQSCEKIGSTSSSVVDNVGPMYRSKEKVQEELIRLAKNQAGAMGGDAIAPESEPWNGAQSFFVYSCDS